MPYKVCVTISEDGNILILSDDSNALEIQQAVSPGYYEIATASGTKIVLARKSDGETCGFGGVVPIYTAPEVPSIHTLLIGNLGTTEYSVSNSSVTLTKSNTYFRAITNTRIVYDVEFSPNNEYVAIATQTNTYAPLTTFFICKYNSSTGDYTPLSIQTIKRTILSVAWSRDNTYLAIIQYTYGTGLTLPNVTIFKRDGDTFTEIPSVPSGPATATTAGFHYGDLAWHPDGDILIVPLSYLPSGNTNRCWAYKRIDDTFSLITSPFIDGASYRTSHGVGVAFSSLGHMVFTAGGACVYTRVGDQFQVLQNIGAGAYYEAAYSPNGLYLAIAYGYSPYLRLYKWSGSSYGQLSIPATPLLNSKCNSLDWSSDGKFLATVAGIANGVVIYELIDDTLSPISINTLEHNEFLSAGFTK